jgi:UDPglucose 6-dehydrogenase
VIGGGYVALVTAAGFAELGHRVSLLETDPAKLAALERGILPVGEPGLPELWQRNQAEGRIRVTGSYMPGLLGAEFVFIALGIPSTSTGKPDLKSLRLAAENIAQVAREPLVVVLKSTVPVGTADITAGTLTRHCQNRHGLPVVSNPEFLREGLAVFDFFHPIRVIVGSSDKSATEAVARLYEPLDAPVIMCDNRTAEMSKYASNGFLATRISFMNEMALLCDAYGVDVMRVADIMEMDPRFGRGYLNAGLGWGGSYLPKDVRGLIYMAKNHGIPMKLVRAAQQINQRQPQLLIRKLREARSLSIIALLEEQGCRIRAYDPLAMETAAKLMHEVTYCADAYEVAKGSDALIIVTEWDEFRELDMQVIASLMNRRILIDGRNLYDPDAMIQAGFMYEGIGHRGIPVQVTRSSLI